MLNDQPKHAETLSSWRNNAERLSGQKQKLPLHTRHVSILKKIFFPCGIDCYQVVISFNGLMSRKPLYIGLQ